MHRFNTAAVILISVVVSALCGTPATAGRIQLGHTTLEFSVPENISAYEHVQIKCRITGKGEATVQAVAADSARYARFFDSAAPHNVSFRIDYLSEDEQNGTFRITNIGNTIWKSVGYGAVSFGHYMDGDMFPGDSAVRTVPLDRLKREDRDEGDRVFSLTICRRDTAIGNRARMSFELVIPDCKPGRSETRTLVMESKPLHSELDEFSNSFVYRELDGKPVNATLSLEAPPWSDTIVVRLVQDGAIRAVSIPINVSEDALRLDGTPNERWTLNGKPIFIWSSSPMISREELPMLRERLGGDNIVLIHGAILNPEGDWYLQAAREYGFKVLPMLSYVRLQWVSQFSDKERLMEGAPLEYGIHRVDALDPDFPKAFAEIVSRTYEYANDVLYRTADGKIPMALSSEQSYGYPFWASNLPTRWGGSSEANVLAFREWLKEKYSTIDKLNKAWKWEYQSFEEIDPSPITTIRPSEYMDPWKEWGPAIEDFDLFRSEIHGDFWRKTVEEIKRRHPDVICGQNVFGGYASDEETIYYGFYNWGVQDYKGDTINWQARRTACLPEDMLFYDFMICWNTGSPDAAKKHVEFWHQHGIDTIIYARPYPKVVPGGDVPIRTHCYLDLDMNGNIIWSYNTSFFPTYKATYEAGGLMGVLNDSYVGSKMNEIQRTEIEMFNREVMRAHSAE